MNFIAHMSENNTVLLLLLHRGGQCSNFVVLLYRVRLCNDNQDLSLSEWNKKANINEQRDVCGDIQCRVSRRKKQIGSSEK